MMAIDLVRGNSEKMIISITVNGTLRNIPAIPQILPHKARESITTSGLRLSEFPIKRGSRILPINSCMKPSEVIMIRNGVKVGN